MTAFSADWLALREPADRRARNQGIAGMLRDAFAPTDRITVCDLGAGTGSSLRALAPLLPAAQDWLLIDHDSGLLEGARRALADWADRRDDAASGGGLRLVHDARTISVTTMVDDLAGDLDRLIPDPIDLITGSALIDLVSDAWLDRLVAAASRRGATVLMTLSYAGAERWTPPHPADAAILAAFIAHQQGDKGFGPALGNRASGALFEKLNAAGYEVVLAPSPWVLAADRDAPLIAMLAEGIAAAVTETGLVGVLDVEDWRATRRLSRQVEIGHIDLFARLP